MCSLANPLQREESDFIYAEHLTSLYSHIIPQCPNTLIPTVINPVIGEDAFAAYHAILFRHAHKKHSGLNSTLTRDMHAPLEERSRQVRPPCLKDGGLLRIGAGNLTAVTHESREFVEVRHRNAAAFHLTV